MECADVGNVVNGDNVDMASRSDLLQNPVMGEGEVASAFDHRGTKSEAIPPAIVHGQAAAKSRADTMINSNEALSSLENAHTKNEDDGNSRPPSPPDNGALTPKQRFCPTRLTSLIPPPNYGSVIPGGIYRASFPQDRNVDFLQTLGIRHVLALVETEPTAGYTTWITKSNIYHTQFNILPNKDGNVSTTPESLYRAVLYVLDTRHWPVLVHCNQGRHRTGCIVACLRRTQGRSLEAAIDEYRTYAAPKAREGDERLIAEFQPAAVFRYAQENGILNANSRAFFPRHPAPVAALESSARSNGVTDVAVSSSASAAEPRDANGSTWLEHANYSIRRDHAIRFRGFSTADLSNGLETANSSNGWEIANSLMGLGISNDSNGPETVNESNGVETTYGQKGLEAENAKEEPERQESGVPYIVRSDFAGLSNR